MDENLLGYLLNALEPDEHRQVEEYLRTNPEAVAKLERLRQTLEPLSADAEQPVPPPTLAIGTLALIAEVFCRPPLPPIPPALPKKGPPTDWSWLRVAAGSGGLYLFVAASVLVIVSGLLTTYFVRAHQAAQNLACKNNLHLWSNALQTYSENQGKQFPRVEPEGSRSFAGVFVPTLYDYGLITPEMTVSCPAIGQEQAPHQSRAELAMLYQNDPNAYQALLPSLAKDYAYSLGYIGTDQQLHGLRRDSGDLLPIMADRPPEGLAGNTSNHGGRGQNVLYIGGQIRFVTERTAGVARDDIYINKAGFIEAGQGLNDTVLAPSEATPYARRCTWRLAD